MFYRQIKALPRLCKLFNLKMTCTFCTDVLRVKVPSFQKVTHFLRYKIFQRDIIRFIFCLFEDIPEAEHIYTAVGWESTYSNVYLHGSRADTATEYLFNVVFVKHDTNISSVELLLRQTKVY